MQAPTLVSAARRPRRPGSGLGACLAILLTWLGASAHAQAGSFAVLVTGDPDLGRIVQPSLESYFTARGDHAGDAGLDAQAVGAVSDCLVSQDQDCARGVVASKRKVDALVVVLVETKPNTKDSTLDVTLTGWLFVGAGAGDLAADRRFCERCRDDDLRAAAGELVAALASSTAHPTGHLRVTVPVGARVLVDGTAVGTVPVDADIAVGPHTVTIEHASGVASKRVTIVHGQTTDLSSAVSGGTPAPSRPSRLLPYALMGAGVVTVGVGITLIAIDEDVDVKKTANRTYFDSAAGGVALTIGGLAAAGAGAYLWHRTRPHSDGAPMVSVVPGAMTVGWSASY